MTRGANILKDCGKPLFFKVANPAEIGFAAPAPMRASCFRPRRLRIRRCVC